MVVGCIIGIVFIFVVFVLIGEEDYSKPDGYEYTIKDRDIYKRF